MQIVIDIPQQAYERICELSGLYYDVAYKAIKNGTVLPDNHGQLKDINDLRKCLRDFRAFHKTLEQALNETPTILKAREVSE